MTGAGERRRGRPGSRERILDAAHRIVESEGASHLTFEALARQTGISRGGVLYNFPSKDDLLRAMIGRHLDRQRDAEIAARGRLPDEANRAIRGIVETFAAEPRDDRCGVLSVLAAVAENPSLLDPVRERQARHAEEIRAGSGDPALSFVALLALEGLFFQEVFNVSALTPAERAAVLERVRRLVAVPAAPEQDG